MNPLLIVANGPSIPEHPWLVDYATRHDTMLINRPLITGPCVRWWLAIDNEVLDQYAADMFAFAGTVLTTTETRPRAELQAKLRRFSAIPGPGYSLTFKLPIHCWRTSVYAAVQLGFALGYDRLFIFGCDQCQHPTTKALYPPGEKMLVPQNEEWRIKRLATEADAMDRLVSVLPIRYTEALTLVSSYNPWPWATRIPRLPHHMPVSELEG
jgi:hypothetical protein